MVSHRAGKIFDGQSNHVVGWSPGHELKELGHNEVRFGRGFLLACPDVLFKEIVSYWVPLFHVLNTRVEFVSCSMSLDFPDSLERIVPVDFNGEIGVIGTTSESQEIISSVVVPEAGTLASDVVFEYIERRLVATLPKSWGRSAQVFQASYLSDELADSIEVVGAINLELRVNELPVQLWFGVGPRMTEWLDSDWRNRVIRTQPNPFGMSDDESVILSIELSDLAVPPGLVIDYMKSGAVIDLDVPVSDSVLLKRAGRLWAKGRLCIFGGRFAVEIVDLSCKEEAFPLGKTRLAVELGQVELDRDGLSEHAQRGAVLLTKLAVSSEAFLVISGERVALGDIGQYDGRFVVTVHGNR